MIRDMLSLSFPGAGTEHPTERITVPVTTSRFLELNLNGLATPSLPSYHTRTPSMSSSTSESCCGHCRWCELPAQPHICNSSAEKHQKICLVTEEILSILFCLKNKTKTIQGFALSNIWSELSTHLVSASRRLS